MRLLNNLLSKLKKSKKSAFIKLKKTQEITKIFDTFNKNSDQIEIRYVGGCLRKILNNEKVDDIDLSVNVDPQKVIEILEKNNIKYLKIGIEHGTITALINEKKFEITSLRKDLITDGRHAIVKFSNDWLEDASRRDFTINSIYSDIDGNLYDPFNGKEDLKIGKVKFIGDTEKRIKEDYLRILRYIRFFSIYSKEKHSPKVIRIIKRNIQGIYNVSPERLLNEFSKIFNSGKIIELGNDSFSKQVIKLIFPQFKGLDLISDKSVRITELINKIDFVVFLALMVSDETDNAEYFIYRFKISNKDKKRILNYKNLIQDKKKASENYLWKIFYYYGKQSLLDFLSLEFIRSKGKNKKLYEFLNYFKDKDQPVFPIKASLLMDKYNLSEGKKLGEKIKKIEIKWVNNQFKISDDEIKNIVNH
tara:strand:+ start:51 stop:1307 length:1257 start_codon:yes stop_codon:yes gene_type:complete